MSALLRRSAFGLVYVSKYSTIVDLLKVPLFAILAIPIMPILTSDYPEQGRQHHTKTRQSGQPARDSARRWVGAATLQAALRAPTCSNPGRAVGTLCSPPLNAHTGERTGHLTYDDGAG